jgi:hypothetical protein
MKHKIKLAVTAALLAWVAASSAAQGDRTPVILELFTSEGCSSCPPADKLLQDLDRKQPIAGADLIVLSEHVDYWNQLGWKDPYSSHFFSERQRDYAESLRSQDVYTPELVIDGQFEAVGSNWSQVKEAVARALKGDKVPLHVSAMRSGDTVQIKVSGDQNQNFKRPLNIFVVLADNQVQSNVGRGENSGHVLDHVAVVRSMGRVGTAASGSELAKDTTIRIDPQWGSKGLRVVAFLQDGNTHHIVGVAQQRL